MNRLLRPLVPNLMALFTWSQRSTQIRRLQRSLQDRILWFHYPGDPHGWMLAQALANAGEACRSRLVPITLPAPTERYAPHPELRDPWALRDCADIAPAWNLTAPATLPKQQAIQRATGRLQALEHDPIAYLHESNSLGATLFEGGTIRQGAGVDTHRLDTAALRLLYRGHFLPGTLYYAGVAYPGIDRLPHLQAVLGGPVRWPDWSQSPPLDTAPVELFYSVRSPYAYLALHRLSAALGDSLVVRPVRPMVQRSMSVPQQKALYIVADANQQALHHGIPFGRVQDPLPGVESVLAIWHVAEQSGRGSRWLLSVARGVWSEGADISQTHTLVRLASYAGLSETQVHEALASRDWVRTVDHNRETLSSLGLWGVPSLRVGSWTGWGQDRVERVLAGRQRPA